MPRKMRPLVESFRLQFCLVIVETSSLLLFVKGDQNVHSVGNDDILVQNGQHNIRRPTYVLHNVQQNMYITEFLEPYVQHKLANTKWAKQFEQQNTCTYSIKCVQHSPVCEACLCAVLGGNLA